MDLVYLYVGEIGRSIGCFEICFSRKFSVKFDNVTGKLHISKTSSELSESSIYGSNIKNVDLVVGKNGSGKSTVLSLLGLSRTERLQEYPLHLNERIQSGDDNKCRWFVLYHIEEDIFAIEGAWCDTIEFMRGDEFLHFQPLYSLSIKYDFEKQTGSNVWPLQERVIGNKEEFHKKLFYLYYDNPVPLEWVTSVKRIKRYDLGSSFMFERVMCERTGYQGIVKYLYAASHDKDFMTLMGTKPGTVIKISLYNEISEFNDVSMISKLDIFHRDKMGRFTIDKKKIAKYVYGGTLQLKETDSIDILKIIRKNELINNGLTFKEAFTIAYLEQLVVHSIIIKESDTLFYIGEKDESKTQYDWQKMHLLSVLRELLGEDDHDYHLTLGILAGLEEIPEKNFVSCGEIEVFPTNMENNFLDKLMLKLDDNVQYYESHEINHRYYIRTEFKGISNGEARMIDIFAMLYSSLPCCCHTKNDTCVLILDEPDIGFHPEWSRVFIEKLTEFLKSDMMRDYKYHIIISTHSPIMLSDVSKNCIHCIAKDKDDRVIVKESDKYGLISSINDILIDDFFVDSVFGSFGEKYVNTIIKEINELEVELSKCNIDTIADCSKKYDEIAKRIELLGDGYIKSSVQKRLSQQKYYIKRMYNN